jgi:hypothetical protein
MNNAFFVQPILNSPYAYPHRHWELDGAGQPTQRILETRRRAEFITPIPKPRKQKGGDGQSALLFDAGLSTQEQQYAHTAVINALRLEVDQWRALPNPHDWSSDEFQASAKTDAYGRKNGGYGKALGGSLPERPCHRIPGLDQGETG